VPQSRGGLLTENSQKIDIEDKNNSKSWNSLRESLALEAAHAKKETEIIKQQNSFV
jgi:hypothetical protein